MRSLDLDASLWAFAQPTLLVGTAASVAAILGMLRRVSVRIRPRRPRPRDGRIRRGVSLAGLAVAFASPTLTAQAGGGSTPRLPWQGASRASPPRPLVPSGHSLHPAVHGSGRYGEPLPRLFERAGERGWEPPVAPRHRPDDRAADPARPRTHEVRPGDTLWSIAELVLQTGDPAPIARYWPRIHRANRALIGADPNLIRPGQVLRLPEPE